MGVSFALRHGNGYTTGGGASRVNVCPERDMSDFFVGTPRCNRLW